MARILTVDDSVAMRQMVEVTLTSAGYDVKQAQNGVEALNIAGTQSFDLVITDVNMPQMDGLAVLDAIRADEGTRDIPVVMLTTSGEERDIRESYARGASGYVVKPMELPQFFETMAGIRHFWMKLNRRPQLG